MNKWYMEEAKKLVEQRLDDYLNIASNVIVGEIVRKTPVDTGNLKGGTAQRKVKKGHYQVYNNVEYAAQREFGGTIKASKAKALTIPISPLSKGKLASDFSDLFIVKSDDGDAFLARESGAKLEYLFVLKKSVTQKAQPFFRPGIHAAKAKLKARGIL